VFISVYLKKKLGVFQSDFFFLITQTFFGLVVCVFFFFAKVPSLIMIILACSFFLIFSFYGQKVLNFNESRPKFLFFKPAWNFSFEFFFPQFAKKLYLHLSLFSFSDLVYFFLCIYISSSYPQVFLCFLRLYQFFCLYYNQYFSYMFKKSYIFQ